MRGIPGLGAAYFFSLMRVDVSAPDSMVLPFRGHRW